LLNIIGIPIQNHTGIGSYADVHTSLLPDILWRPDLSAATQKQIFVALRYNVMHQVV
jgi:hypothetical protein